jgi:hypothetical protein
MKNITLKLFSLVVALIMVIGCDPLEDIYDKLDKNPAPITADLELTLEDDDYELSGIESAANYHNFSSIDDAKEGIPNILDAKYPQLGKTSSALVHYDLYQGSVKYLYDDYEADYAGGVVSNPIPTYTVQQSDYDEILGTPNYGNFDNMDDVNAFLNWKYPSVGANEGVVLTYDWYPTPEGGNPTSGTFTKHYGVWYFHRILSAEDGDYEYMQRGSRDYFSSSSDAEEKIPVWLKPQFPYAKAGDRYLVQYLFRDYDDTDDNGWAKEKPRVVLSEYNGSEWEMITSITQMSLQLGHNGTVWEPDNTIKYTLTSSDYADIAAAYADINPSGSGSMTTYGNYDLALWSTEQIQESIGGQLLNIFPSAAEGQKYLVTYKFYSGGVGTSTVHLILTDGVYVPVE